MVVGKVRSISGRVVPLAGLAALLLFLVLVLSIVKTSIFGEVELEKHIYFEIVFLLLLAVLGEISVAYLKLPSVMILLVLGMLMSQSFLSIFFGFVMSQDLFSGIIEHPPDVLKFGEVIHVFAQLGAVILLFKVGLHNKIERIFSMDNILVATAGVVVPFAVGYLYASVSGGSFAYSMFLGAALTATSVGVTVAILREFGLVKERFAQIIVGAAIIDDVLGLLVLSVVINVSGGGEFIGPLVSTLVSAAIFLIGSILAGGYFIRYLDRKEMSPRRFMTAIAFMLMYAYVAEFIQLSAIVGAFIAGVILNQSRHIKDIEEKTYGLEMLFMPIFFISLGILIDVNALGAFAIPILVLTVIAMLSKTIACAAAGVLAKLRIREALLVGVGMSPRGEVALIVASIGLSTSVLTSAEYSVISAMALLTTFVVPPMLTRILGKAQPL